MNEEKIVDTSVEVNHLMAGKGLSMEEAAEVLIRLAADLCMDHIQPMEAASRLTQNVQKYVKINKAQQEKLG